MKRLDTGFASEINFPLPAVMSLHRAPPKSEYSWREDLRRFLRMMIHFDFMWIIALVAVLGAIVFPLFAGCRSTGKQVIVYASQDQV